MKKISITYITIITIFYVILDIMALHNIYIKQHYNPIMLFGSVIIYTIGKEVSFSTEKQHRIKKSSSIIVFIIALIFAFVGSDILKHYVNNNFIPIAFKGLILTTPIMYTYLSKEQAEK